MFYVGFCSVCGEGVLGTRVCAGGDMVALCDECDAVWLSPELHNEPHFPAQPNLPCPHCNKTLATSPARWATADDLASPANEQWLEAVLGTGEPLGESDDSCESFI